MLNQFESYLSFENIYLWANFGVLPFWIMLILFPQSKITHFFVNSIILPLLLSTAYIFVLYKTILLDEPIINVFKLYIDLDSLYTIFANENFLLIFWLHFLAVNLFLGSWISKDAIKYNISRGLVFTPMLLVYFSGPLGFVLYWFFRIFYAKKISIHE